MKLSCGSHYQIIWSGETIYNVASIQRFVLFLLLLASHVMHCIYEVRPQVLENSSRRCIRFALCKIDGRYSHRIVCGGIGASPPPGPSLNDKSRD